MSTLWTVRTSCWLLIGSFLVLIYPYWLVKVSTLATSCNPDWNACELCAEVCIWKTTEGAIVVAIFLLVCNNALGLENGNIKDSQITAGGSGAATRPFDVRHNNPNSWCVNSQFKGVFVDNFYLEIDMLKIKKITSILLAGSKKYPKFSYGPKIKIGYKLTQSDSFKFKVCFV